MKNLFSLKKEALLACIVFCLLIYPTFQGHSHPQQCKPAFPCSQCNTAPDVCTACVKGDGRSGDKLPKCVCLDGYYEKGQNNPNCAKCESPCQTCSTKTKCIKCVQQGQGRKPAPDCSCLPNYFESKNICSICNVKCEACRNKAEYCTKCAEGKGRSKRAPECECLPGYFEPEGNTSKDCTQCEYPCQTCNESPTNCLTCGFEPEKRTTKPFCKCQNQFFEKDQQCLNCAPNCEDCTNTASNCKTCKLNPTRQQDAPKCSCKPGYFDDFVNADCPTCDSACATCDKTATNCLTCKGTPDFRLPPPSCGCEKGYYNDKLQCKKCDKLCTECVDSAKNCTACAAGQNRSGKVPSCGCADGFFEKDSDLNCLTCEYPCATCSGEPKNCLTCGYGDNRKEAPNCSCAERTFERSQQCIKCDFRCETCDDVGRVCTSCRIGYQRNMQVGLCGCKDGYYDNGRSIDCQPCNYPCATCENKADNCLSCGYGLNRQAAPECYCEVGFLEKNQFCVNECDSRCKLCEDLNKSQCTVCAQDFSYFALQKNGKKLCYNKCPKGFRSDPENETADDEIPCVCETDNCDLKVIVDRYTAAGIGYTEIQGKIVKCKQEGCINCDGNENICKECDTMFFLNNKQICEQCHPSCSSCYGPTNSECYICSSLTWNSLSVGSSQKYKGVCPDKFSNGKDVAHQRELQENFRRGLSSYDSLDCFNLNIDHSQCQLNVTEAFKEVERNLTTQFQYKLNNTLWRNENMTNKKIIDECTKQLSENLKDEFPDYQLIHGNVLEQGHDITFLSLAVSQVVGNIVDLNKKKYTPQSLNQHFLNDTNSEAIEVVNEILPYGNQANNFTQEVAICYYKPKDTFEIGNYVVEQDQDLDLKADVQSSDIDNSQCYNTDSKFFKRAIRLLKNNDPNLFFIVDICTTEKKIVKGLFLRKGVPVDGETKAKGVVDIRDGEDGENPYQDDFYEFYDPSDDSSERKPFEITEVDPEHMTNKLLRISHIKVIRKEFKEAIIQDVIDKYDRKVKNSECSLDPINFVQDQIMEFVKNKHCSSLANLNDLPQGTVGQMRYPFIQKTVMQDLKSAISGIGNQLLQVTYGTRSIIEQYVLNNWYTNNCDCNAQSGEDSIDSPFTNGTGIKLGRSKTSSCMYGGRYQQKMERQNFQWRGAERATEYISSRKVTLDLVKEQILVFQELWNLNNPKDLITVDGIVGEETEYRISITPLSGFLKTESPKLSKTPCRSLDNQEPEEYSHSKGREYYNYAKMNYCREIDLRAWRCEVCKSRERLSQMTIVSLDRRTTDFKHQGFVAYSQSKNQIIVSFRGGQSTRNWVSNLNSFFRKRLDYCFKCKGHRGYYNAWKSLRTRILEAYEQVRAKHPSAKTLLTGHSIGGAIAIYAALDLVQRGIVVDELYVYGSPRIGNVEFVEYLQKVIPNTYNVINQNDIIPYLPYRSKSYNRMVKEIWYTSNGSTFQKCINNFGNEDAKCYKNVLAYSLSKHFNYFGYHTSCELPFMKQLLSIAKKPWKGVKLSSNEITEIDTVIQKYEPPADTSEG